MEKKKVKDRTRKNNNMWEQDPSEVAATQEPAVLKEGVLNPRITKPIKGEIGTDAKDYENSGLTDSTSVSGTEEDFDEEDDSRLAAV